MNKSVKNAYTLYVVAYIAQFLEDNYEFTFSLDYYYSDANYLVSELESRGYDVTIFLDCLKITKKIKKGGKK